ncbi:LOW QUALITY PROTEIN: hypothetical protein TorRG33x02_263970 [Trema orientale]|uniref:Uncharacterized protein n=1 Tax=Trema orientale TaxID=63057 RepID=A0A2P5D2W0_TREOI|nr:LOW QUALITY PROTEIN: hypothetical protein TorRG33x02_263970 [Trema orientale]
MWLLHFHTLCPIELARVYLPASFLDQKLALVGSVMETNARFDAMNGQKPNSPLFVLFVIMGFNILPLPD